MTQQQTQSYLITTNRFFLFSLGQLVAVTTGFQIQDIVTVKHLDNLR